MDLPKVLTTSATKYFAELAETNSRLRFHLMFHNTNGNEAKEIVLLTDVKASRDGVEETFKPDVIVGGLVLDEGFVLRRGLLLGYVRR